MVDGLLHGALRLSDHPRAVVSALDTGEDRLLFGIEPQQAIQVVAVFRGAYALR